MTKIITIKDKVNYTLNSLKDNNDKPEEYLKSIKDIIYFFNEKEKHITVMGLFDFLLSNKLYQPLKLIIKELYNE